MIDWQVAMCYTVQGYNLSCDKLSKSNYQKAQIRKIKYRSSQRQKKTLLKETSDLTPNWATSSADSSDKTETRKPAAAAGYGCKAWHFK